MTNEQERAEFEAWANGRCELHLVNPAGRYSSAITQFAFEAYQAGRAALQSQDREDAAFLQEEDQHDLHRFIETTEDGQGYDIGKDRIKRLAELGVVSNQGFGRYSVTMFGYWCHERYWHQNPTLPLKTIDEHNAQAAIDHAMKIEGQ